MTNDLLSELISRKLAGEASSEELEELTTYLQNNPAEQYFAELLTTYWHTTQNKTPVKDPYFHEHFNHILQMAGNRAVELENEIERFDNQVRMHSRRMWIRRMVAVAVTIITVGCIWWFIKNGNEQNLLLSSADNHIETVVAKKGTRSRMILPDGTQVWLNSESKLQYKDTFNDSIREVHLTGEGFFDVKKDSNRPFIVHTSGIDIKVLGTAFNVKAYSGEPTVEATLIHGLIEVVNINELNAPVILLHPHEKLVFNRNKKTDLTRNKPSGTLNKISQSAPAISINSLAKNISDTAIVETSWVYNKLIFDGDSFQELAVKMERWFNVKIQFRNNRIAAYRLKGVFENETIEQALEELQLIAKFSYSIKEEEVIIDKKRIN